MTNAVYIDRDDTIATVVINQPERRNAMNLTIFSGLLSAFQECHEDPALRCVILRGAGGKAFSAGADISEFETVRNSAAQAREYAKTFHAAADAVGNCRHPVVAQIEGACVGGGLAMASLCDIRICGTSSRFGVPVKRLGLVEAHAELAPLVKKFGPNIALEILLIGDVFGADDAMRLGFVNRIVPDANVATASMDVAQKIAAGAPLSARWHKKFIYRLLDPTPLSDAEIEEGFACFDTEDFQTGYKAFLEKSEPVFQGR